MAQLFSSIVRSLEAARLEEGLNGDLDYVRIEDLNIERPGRRWSPTAETWQHSMATLSAVFAGHVGSVRWRGDCSTSTDA